MIEIEHANKRKSRGIRIVLFVGLTQIHVQVRVYTMYVQAGLGAVHCRPKNDY